MDNKSIISIYLSNKENLKILEESLHQNYIIKIDAPFNIQTDADLIIIDGVFLNQNEHFIQLQKNLQYPVFLPVLLLTTRHDIGVGTSSLWKYIDNVIMLPINKTVLFANIALCLKTRRLSVENQNISEKKYQEILESINDIFFVLDEQYKFNYFNKAAEIFFDLSSKSVLGKKMIDVLPLLTSSVIENNFNEVIKTGTSHTFDYNLLKNGENISLEISTYPNQKGISVYIKDISSKKQIENQLILAKEKAKKYEDKKKALKKRLLIEKKAMKELEKSEFRYRTLIEEATVATALYYGPEMRVQYANDLMMSYWGKDKSILGKPLIEALPELKSQPFLRYLENVYLSGKSYIGVEEKADILVNRKLETFYLNFTYKALRHKDGNIYGIHHMAIDVTSEVFTKKALEEAKKDAELKTQIAEEAVKSKQQFLSNMSHEIRTPLNSIIGFTNVVLKTRLDDLQKECLNAVKESGEALILIINDILDIAKVDAGKMTFEKSPFNLYTSISTMLYLFEPKMKEKNLEMIKEYDNSIPQILVGDHKHLRQIILNLVSNAVKFTKQGKITVQIHLLKENAEKVTIEFLVSDTGIGIPENKMGQIFNKFEQAEPNNSLGGTGLGLTIVKQLVELQGGTVISKSELGKGSTFGFVLDFEKGSSEAKIESEVAADLIKGNSLIVKSVKDIKVLVAEDVELNQLLIKIILLGFGFDIEIVSNGKIAIEKMQKNKYDIILMDLLMPEMNGFEATEYIRDKMKSQIPIIALTADVTSEDLEKCISVGMNDYVFKPIDENILYSKIIKYLKKP